MNPIDHRNRDLARWSAPIGLTIAVFWTLVALGARKAAELAWAAVQLAARLAR